ncbi:MAG: HAD-IIIA family hydrolase [Clostridia bacterium]|nr:HAD-IIIA family hydrolase [Clostridia bacterium]
MKTVGHFFQPEDLRSGFDAYPAKELAASGIRALLCDIDNTLVPYEEEEPNEAVLAWLQSLAEEGISVGLISNNAPERVERFNRDLGLFAVPDARKPSVKGLKAFLKETGTDSDSAAVLGDQIFTDVCMAHRCGVPALLVPPIRDKKTVLFRIKRALERPFLARYLKQKARSKKT